MAFKSNIQPSQWGEPAQLSHSVPSQCRCFYVIEYLYFFLLLSETKVELFSGSTCSVSFSVCSMVSTTNTQQLLCPHRAGKLLLGSEQRHIWMSCMSNLCLVSIEPTLFIVVLYGSKVQGLKDWFSDFFFFFLSTVACSFLSVSALE